MVEVRAKRATKPLALLAALVLLAGCGDGADTARPPAPTPTEPLFNPCSALDVDQVSRLLDADLRLNAGTPAAPTCSLTPAEDGGPVVDANYQLIPQGLDAIFDAMGDLDPDDVETVRVPGADDARVVVDFDDQQLYVSGFVQNGELVQTVDVVDPLPYDRARVVSGVRQILRLFSDGAPSPDQPSDEPSDQPSASPSVEDPQ